uniref:40S ribosome protein S15 n=1 Tax=Griffithsia japonica TaxID=83288 RepID=Q7XYA2_GRIJA|nr:40S ribosome protein S15 [Griffithsia japonica]
MPPRRRKVKKKYTNKKFSYRGVELANLQQLSHQELIALLPARPRRRLKKKGLDRKHAKFLKKLRLARNNCKEGEKPAPVKTHLRNMVVTPEMIGNVVGVYNGIAFAAVEIKPQMIGFYLGEFSISYKPVAHGRPGIGATNSSRFIPLK